MSKIIKFFKSVGSILLLIVITIIPIPFFLIWIILTLLKMLFKGLYYMGKGLIFIYNKYIKFFIVNPVVFAMKKTGLFIQKCCEHIYSFFTFIKDKSFFFIHKTAKKAGNIEGDEFLRNESEYLDGMDC